MRVFVTGATGFIGGSVACGLVAKGHRVVGLARSPGAVDGLKRLGIEPVLGTLDDARILAREAAAADAVVNAADSDHRGAVAALIDALAHSGKPLIHTSGSSIVGGDDRGEVSERVYSEEEIAPGSGWEPASDKVARVAIDRLVLAASERGVRSVVLCNTLIYGHGRGLARDSVQIPRLLRQAETSKIVRHVGAGKNIWSNVHIDDVVDLYVRALAAAPAGSFAFVENGEESFGRLAQAIADSLGLGAPQPWDIGAAIAEWGFEPAVYALGSNSRVRGTLARTELGWQPRHNSAVDWIRAEVTRSG